MYPRCEKVISEFATAVDSMSSTSILQPEGIRSKVVGFDQTLRRDDQAIPIRDSYH